MKKFSNDQMYHFFAIISVVSMVLAMIAGVANAINPRPILDLVFTCGMIMFILPFVTLPVTMTAGIYWFGLEPSEFPLWAKRVMYMIVFPFVIMWFFAGVNALFNLVPRIKATETNYQLEGWIYIGSIYVTLIVLGLIWKSIRSKKLLRA